METATEQVSDDSGIIATGAEVTTQVSDSGTTEPTLTSKPNGDQTTTPDLSQPATQEFYDPSTLPPELLPLQKQLQAAFTQKMQEQAELIRANQAKIDAYDRFNAHPEQTARAVLQQLGVSTDAQQSQPAVDSEWNPENWGQVLDRFKEEARTDVLKELEPVIGKVREMQKTQVETMLDNQRPDWRAYEKQMIDLLGKHPTLSQDPIQLYELALPTEVRNRRAMQAAMKQLETTGKGAEVSGASETTKEPTSLPAVSDFASAVEHAKARIAQGHGVQ